MSDLQRYLFYLSRFLGWSGYLITMYVLWKAALKVKSLYRKKDKRKETVQESVGWKTIFALALISVVFFGSSQLTRYKSNRMLGAEALKLSSELIHFSNSRAQRTQRKPNESFTQYRNRIIAEDAETQSLYAKLYYRKVANLRDEFARRGLTDKDLDEFYERPSHPLGIREVGERLLYMGETLYRSTKQVQICSGSGFPVMTAMRQPVVVQIVKCAALIFPVLVPSLRSTTVATTAQAGGEQQGVL